MTSRTAALPDLAGIAEAQRRRGGHRRLGRFGHHQRHDLADVAHFGRAERAPAAARLAPFHQMADRRARLAHVLIGQDQRHASHRLRASRPIPVTRPGASGLVPSAA